MEKFTAEDARGLSSSHDEKLNEVIENIKNQASRNNTRAFVYESLPNSVVEELKERGFEVEPQSSIAIQKDSLYYIIEW